MVNNTDNFADNILNGVFENVQNPENAYHVGELLDKYGLSWKISKEVLNVPSGQPSGFYGIVREDTQKCFTTCKESYMPFQNTELAEMLIRISEKTGYEIHSGGSFNGGGKVFLQLKSPNKIQGIGTNNDSVNGFLTGINSHDGTTSLKWGETNITISCRNTFMYASKGLKQSARHTQSIHTRVEDAIRTLQGVITDQTNLFDKFIRLSNIEIKPIHIAQVVKNITDVDVMDKGYRNNDKNTTYAINRTNELLASISTEINQKGQSLWGLMSGVTNYTTHKMPVPSRENARLESLYTGSGFAVNNGAFNKILEFAN